MSYHNHLGFNAPDAIDTEDELANAVCLMASYGHFEISLNGIFIRGDSEGATVYIGLYRVTERTGINKAALVFADAFRGKRP
jgi:hypothetical protein